jgi:hypothetical protein
VYPLVLLGTLLAALVFASVRYDRDDPTSRLGGDYPSFYAAGSIARSGDWGDLYVAARQQEAQAGLINDSGGFLYFAYPPFVAAAYSALAGLSYQWSFLVHSVLMGAALAATVLILWPWLSRFGLPRQSLILVALACYPILRAVAGGQNTTLTLLVVAAAARLDREERPWLAGGVLALALFKPQFGLVLAVPVVVGRRWRVLAGWAGGALVLYVVSAALMGAGWISEWWRQAGVFGEQNLDTNGVSFVSLPGFLANVAGSGAEAIGTAAGLVVLAGAAYFWWRFPRRDALERYSVAILAAVLLAPQTLYYDAGVGLLAVGALLGSVGARRRTLIVVVLAASWVQLAAPELGWSPLGPLLWALTAGVAWSLRGGRRLATPV